MPKKKKDTSNKPWVENYPPLAAWLEKHKARCLWQIPSNPEPTGDDYDTDWHPQFYIEGYIVPGHAPVPFIVIVRADKMGWDIYTSLNEVEINLTLVDAEKRLGIVS